MFNTDAGTFNDRFVLTALGSSTAITEQPASDSRQPSTVYSLGGTRISTDGAEGLPAGTYIVKQGNESTKVIVK